MLSQCFSLCGLLQDERPPFFDVYMLYFHERKDQDLRWDLSAVFIYFAAGCGGELWNREADRPGLLRNFVTIVLQWIKLRYNLRKATRIYCANTLYHFTPIQMGMFEKLRYWTVWNGNFFECILGEHSVICVERDHDSLSLVGLALIGAARKEIFHLTVSIVFIAVDIMSDSTPIRISTGNSNICSLNEAKSLWRASASETVRQR